MKPQVPEGLTVRYVHAETTTTPGGRRLPKPHRMTLALLERELHKPYDHKVVVASGYAIAKEGPTLDEQNPRGCKLGGCKYDQFSRQVGRDVALGRAIKRYWEIQQMQHRQDVKQGLVLQ